MADARILLVAPEAPVAEDVEKHLKRLGHTVCATAASADQAIDRAIAARPRLALVDLVVDGRFDGSDAAERLRARLDLPVVYLTDGAEGDLLHRGWQVRPFGYVLKPVEKRQLRLAIETALRIQDGKTILTDRERRLAVILDHVDAAVMTIDASGLITFMNPLAESLAGRWQAELANVPLPEVFHVIPEKHVVPGETVSPESNVVLNVLHWGARLSGSSARLRRKTGEDITVNYHAAPLRDAQQNLSGAVLVFQPGTKAQEMEQELKRTVIKLQSRLRLMETVFESISDGVAVADKNGRYLLTNRVADRITGAGVSAKGKPFGEWSDIYGVFHADEKTPLPSHELPIVRAIHGEATDVELFLRNRARPEGAHLSVSGRPLRSDIDGTSAGVIVMRDISGRKATEKKLQETVEQLQQQTRLMQAIFDGMSDGVVVADKNFRFTLFNPAAERIVGKGLVDMEPDQWTAEYGIFYNDRVTPVPTDDLPLVRAVNGEAVDEVEMFIRNASRPMGVHLSVNGRPIASSGIAGGGVIVFRDVTERVRAEEALAQAFAQGRLEVLDTILHNVGNAINSVAVGVGTLQEQLTKNRLLQRFSSLAGAVKAHQEDWNDYIQHDPQGQQVLPFLLSFADALARQNRSLLRTVERVRSQSDHIVDIVRTQRGFGNLHTTRKDVNLQQAVKNALGLLKEPLARRGIRTHLNFGSAPEEIRIEESPFHQMLVNLFKNAMEATDELRQSGGLRGLPRIEVRAYVTREFLVLEVIDNGIGIASKDLKAVFRAGYTTKPEGTGLGLHSAANFVIGSGGKMQPLSDGLGQGTTMRVMLRLAAVSPAGEARGGRFRKSLPGVTPWGSDF